MNIILLRHGKAEKAKDPARDAERELTSAGRRTMRAVLPDVMRLLPPEGRVLVWSSPMIRARQTAHIALESIRDIWGENRIVEPSPVAVDPLADSGISGLLVEIACHFGWLAAPEMRGVTGNRPVQENVDMPEPPRSVTHTESTDRGGPEEDGYSAPDPNEEEILLMVGHVPQLVELAQCFTGQEIKLKAGAAICLEAEDDLKEKIVHAHDFREVMEMFQGAFRVKWFIQGPDFSRWEILADLEKILRDRFDRVVKYVDRFREFPDDPDNVHDLRVSIRTLRSLITFIEPFQKNHQSREMQRGLREIIVRLSRLREYDVLIEESKRVSIDLTPAAESLTPPKTLREELIQLRREECDRVSREFSRHHFSEQLTALEEEFRHIRWGGKVERRGLRIEELIRRRDQLTKSFLDRYRSLDVHDADASHNVRKAAKKVRYVTNVMKPLLGERQDVVEEMKQIQDRLGALCDARVNAQILREISRSTDLSEIAVWQADNLVALEREDEEALVKELGSRNGTKEV
ncbi:MAG: CHAD domain-containing protein [Anaerovoracaceae bacterium]|jgi:CHAD domain-containing protein/phosphohistidine phosphatase SixA